MAGGAARGLDVGNAVTLGGTVPELSTDGASVEEVGRPETVGNTVSELGDELSVRDGDSVELVGFCDKVGAKVIVGVCVGLAEREGDAVKDTTAVVGTDVRFPSAKVGIPVGRDVAPGAMVVVGFPVTKASILVGEFVLTVPLPGSKVGMAVCPAGMSPPSSLLGEIEGTWLNVGLVVRRCIELVGAMLGAMLGAKTWSPMLDGSQDGLKLGGALINSGDLLSSDLSAITTDKATTVHPRTSASSKMMALIAKEFLGGFSSMPVSMSSPSSAEAALPLDAAMEFKGTTGLQ